MIPVLLLYYHQKLIRYILKSKQKNKCGCIHEKCGCILINHNENKDEKKKGSNRYDINRPNYKHGYKYSKYKKCLDMMMLMCIKQHLSNIHESLIHEA